MGCLRKENPGTDRQKKNIRVQTHRYVRGILPESRDVEIRGRRLEPVCALSPLLGSKTDELSLAERDGVVAAAAVALRPLHAGEGDCGDNLELEEARDVVERREDEDGDDVLLQGDVVAQAEEGDANGNVPGEEIRDYSLGVIDERITEAAVKGISLCKVFYYRDRGKYCMRM